MPDDEMSPYAVRPSEGGFLVVCAGDITILESRDRANAEHYVELLNRAYRAGYKMGYRAGRGRG